MPNDVETITISLVEYQTLMEDSRILQALYAAGVDNWEWYDEAMESVNEEVD